MHFSPIYDIVALSRFFEASVIAKTHSNRLGFGAFAEFLSSPAFAVALAFNAFVLDLRVLSV